MELSAIGANDAKIKAGENNTHGLFCAAWALPAMLCSMVVANWREL